MTLYISKDLNVTIPKTKHGDGLVFIGSTKLSLNVTPVDNSLPALKVFLGVKGLDLGENNQNDSIEINAFRWPQHQIQDFFSVSVKSELLVQLYKGYGSKMLLEMTTVFENGEKLVYVFKDEQTHRTRIELEKTWEAIHYNVLESLPFLDKLELSVELTLKVNLEETAGLSQSLAQDSGVTMKRMLDQKAFCDFSIVTKEDVKIPCHQCFVVAPSKVFTTMMQADCKEAKEKFVKLLYTEEVIRTMLEFLYCGNYDEALKKPIIALSLLEIGHQYDIIELEKVMKRIFSILPNSWFDLDVAVQLFAFSSRIEEFVDLKRKAFTVIKFKLDGFPSFLKDLSGTDPKLAKELLDFDSKSAP